MKKVFMIAVLICICMQNLHAQQAKLCFINMPDTLCPLFTAVNRADFVDFLDSKMKAVVTNRLDGKSEMTEMSSDYISIQTTPHSSWQMKMLPVNDSTKVICTVSTVCASVCDSHIRFFTSAWKELPASSFLPSDSLKIDDFLQAVGDSVDVYEYQQACRQADVLFMKASLNSRNTDLTFVCNTPDYMEKKAGSYLRPLLRTSVSYVWREGRFVLSK